MKMSYEANLVNGMQEEPETSHAFSRLLWAGSAAEPGAIAFQDGIVSKLLWKACFLISRV